MVDLGDFLEVTSAITGRRILINKMAIATITESVADSPTMIRFDPDMYVPAKESYNEIAEAFASDEEYE